MTDEKARIEKVLADHALVGERYIREKHGHADVCRCGSLHPQFGGRWPTHRQHVAEQIARVFPPGSTTAEEVSHD